MYFSVYFGLVLTAACFVCGEHDQFDSLTGPLILTPYIEKGRIEEAQKAALVTGIKPHIESYAGFFNVDKKCDSNLFFWYFPSQSNPKTDPVSVWLNGGPGASSMSTLLLEHGPYELTRDNELKLRKHAWNRNSSIVYFDNPVGTGYSFTKGPFHECYAKNQTQISQSFLRALEQFFKLFPELQGNPFYLTGVSYAGKYIPSIAHAIHTTNTTIKLTGFAIGNGWMHPYTQIKGHNILYQLGFVDDNTKFEMSKIEDAVQKLILQHRYEEALQTRKNWTKLFELKTGYTSLYNYLEFPCEEKRDHMPFLNRTDIRKALHVGNATQHNGTLVYEALKPDVMKSVKSTLETLMDDYRVLLYYGQTDLLVYPGNSMEFSRSLVWKGGGGFFKADRKIYKVGNETAGYVRAFGNFSEIVIRNAGHRAPLNQPQWTFDMYNKFIYNITFA